MRRYFIRLFGVVLIGASLPSSLPAQHGDHAGAVVDSYRAASPYNATVVGRPAPNPSYNMVSFTLPCDIPNMNTATYVWPEHDRRFGCGGALGGGCNSGCGNQCSALFSRPSFGCGHANWQRWSGSCGSTCSTSSCGGCAATSPCGTATAPAVVPATPPQTMPDVKPVGFWKRAESPVDQCQNCPPNGPKPKHTAQHPGSLGCASCSTVVSESVFLFGSCRQFFGEPTHNWLHGK